MQRDEILTVQEVADELKVSIEQVRAWIRENRLAAYKLGREYRVRRSMLNIFLESRRTDHK